MVPETQPLEESSQIEESSHLELVQHFPEKEVSVPSTIIPNQLNYLGNSFFQYDCEVPEFEPLILQRNRRNSTDSNNLNLEESSLGSSDNEHQAENTQEQIRMLTIWSSEDSEARPSQASKYLITEKGNTLNSTYVAKCSRSQKKKKNKRKGSVSSSSSR